MYTGSTNRKRSPAKSMFVKTTITYPMLTFRAAAALPERLKRRITRVAWDLSLPVRKCGGRQTVIKDEFGICESPSDLPLLDTSIVSIRVNVQDFPGITIYPKGS